MIDVHFVVLKMYAHLIHGHEMFKDWLAYTVLSSLFFFNAPESQKSMFHLACVQTLSTEILHFASWHSSQKNRLSQNCRHIHIISHMYTVSQYIFTYAYIMCFKPTLEYISIIPDTWIMCVTSCPFCLRPPPSEVRNHHPRNLEVASFLAAQCGTHRLAPSAYIKPNGWDGGKPY